MLASDFLKPKQESRNRQLEESSLVWVCDEETKYYVHYVKVTVDEVGDTSFFTEEELIELHGDNSWKWGGYHQFRHNVEEDLLYYISQIPDGKKSIKIDEELVDYFVKFELPVSSFVSNTRRVGNRLSVHDPKKQDKFKKTDVKIIIETIFWGIQKKFNIDVDAKYVVTNISNYMNFLKTIYTVEQLIEIIEEVVGHPFNRKFTGDVLESFKELYKNPNLFEKEVDPTNK